MKKMQAIILSDFGDAGNMRIADVERPQPGPEQILIKVAATSVNRPDIIQREGNYPPPPGESEILGLEAAGTVETVGENVTTLQPGARVMALLPGGGYAEYAIARADHAMPLPPGMDFAAAACICETYLTAYLNLFLIANLRDQQTVLLHGGGGGVTTAAMQLCRQLAPNARIIVTASPGKVKRVRELGEHGGGDGDGDGIGDGDGGGNGDGDGDGVDGGDGIGGVGVDGGGGKHATGEFHVIDYHNESFAERVREITAKRGADVILDHIGGPYLAPNLQSLAVGGTLMLIGVLGGATAEINLARAMVKRQRIIGSVLRSRPPPEKAAIISKFAAAVMPHFASAAITPLIHATYPLRDAADAHRAMEAGGHFGKIVLVVGG